MKKIILYFFIAFYGMTNLFAQAKTKVQDDNAPMLTFMQEQTVEMLFAHKGEIYFTFMVTSREEINHLTKIISIDNVQNGLVSAIANKREFAKFIALGYAYTLQPNPNELEQMQTIDASSMRQLTVWNAYPTYTAYETIMQQFVADHPNICKLVNIGTLASGRKLLVLKITDNINVKEDEPQFLYTSSMHGDEIAGYVGMLHYIDYLLTNYGTDARVTSLINNMEIWINPLANPDGTYAGGNTTVNGATRANVNNIDLNRNYPDPENGPHPDGNAYQLETIAFMNFADTMNFVMSANFHGGSEVVNYPWDTYVRAHADTNWWIRESKKYADTAQAHGPANYFTNVQASGYTDGFLWYEVNGGRQDYMNYFKHCREFTVELSMTKILQPANLLTNWDANYRSWLTYMEEALHGVRGIIKDACTNQPIRAKVYIAGHDVDSSEVYSARAVGNYHRPIYQGTYNLTYSAPGYVSQTISGITAVDGATVIQNVTLSPAAPQVNFTTASTNICGGNAQFTDLTGSATAWHWSFGDGNSSTQQNPAHSYTASGTYTVKLIAENCAGRDSLTQTNYITVTIPEAPTAQTVTACAPATLNLSATASGTVNWYSAATGGNPLATAANYTTPTLTSSTTYYLENEITGTVQHLGAANNTIGTGNFYTGANYNYLRFTATNSFKLLSVLVNANTAGSRTIELRNSANTVLQTKTVNIPAGSSRVILNFNIPVGTNMQLGVAGANGLYRNNAGAAFPYTINNIVSITGNSANNTVSYYYFYDWEITKPCVSPRVPLLVTINQNANTPTITEASGILTSSAATGNQWYNSLTGIIAGATATSYTPTANGTYYVLQTDANGCVSNASNSINFSLTTTENLHENATAIAIYPNPTSGECKIDLSNLKSFERSFATKIVLYNVLGEEVFSMKTIEKIATLTIKNQAKGMYLVKIFDENNQYIGLGKINLN